VPRPTPSVLLTDRGSVEGLLSREGADLSLDDGRDGAVDAGEGARADDAIAYASAEVLRYCGAHYAGAQLELSASAWEWATVLAAALRLPAPPRQPGPGATLAQRGGRTSGGELAAVLTGASCPLEAAVAQRVQRRAAAWRNATLDPRYRGQPGPRSSGPRASGRRASGRRPPTTAATASGNPDAWGGKSWPGRSSS
jgi:hypothetical protein